MGKKKLETENTAFLLFIIIFNKLNQWRIQAGKKMGVSSYTNEKKYVGIDLKCCSFQMIKFILKYTFY